VGLAAKADDLAGTLSGGQKKLLEVCRALSREPKVVLLDEPAAGVNPSLLIELAGHLKELRGPDQTFVVVEHNMDLVAALCDLVHVMVEGSVVAEGSLAVVAADDMVRDAYFGEGLGI
jgi:ABC-type branched-subunit amino acid transport system ATPase component